jgi:hypothetical protein
VRSGAGAAGAGPDFVSGPFDRRYRRALGPRIWRWCPAPMQTPPPSSPPNDPQFCRAGTFLLRGSFVFGPLIKERRMHGLIYLIGLIVVILAILSFFGLR